MVAQVEEVKDFSTDKAVEEFMELYKSFSREEEILFWETAIEIVPGDFPVAHEILASLKRQEGVA